MAEAMYFMLHLTGIVACISACAGLVALCVQVFRGMWND
jgi:hypothetical protein